MTLSQPVSSLLLSESLRKSNCNKSYRHVNALKQHLMQGRCPIEILRIIHVRALASIRVDNLKSNSAVSARPSLRCDSVHESFPSTMNISYVNICVHPLSYFTFSPRFCTKTLTLQDRCPYRHLSPIAHPSHSPLGADFFFSSLAKSLASCESCPASRLLTLHLARSLPLFPLGRHSSSHYLASSTSWAPFGSISYLDRARHLSKGTTGSWMYSTNIRPPGPPRFKTTFSYFHNSSTISHPYSISVFSP